MLDGDDDDVVVVVVEVVVVVVVVEGAEVVPWLAAALPSGVVAPAVLAAGG